MNKTELVAAMAEQTQLSKKDAEAALKAFIDVVSEETERGRVMVREIVHDPMFLQRKSEDATQADLQTAQDLLDTLRANFDRCVGMAANMIGVAKRIIAINDNGKYLVMFNPEIISKFGEFETEEGCLSLDGERKTVRYKTIKVKYFNENFKQIKRSFSDFTAQIIQHEIDHCNGILI